MDAYFDSASAWLGLDGALLGLVLGLVFLCQFLLCAWMIARRRLALARSAGELRALAGQGRFDELRVRAFETESALALALRDGIAMMPAGLLPARYAAYRHLSISRFTLELDFFLCAGVNILLGWCFILILTIGFTGPLFGFLYLMLFLLLVAASLDLAFALRSGSTLPTELMSRLAWLARRGDREAALELTERQPSLLARAMNVGLRQDNLDDARDVAGRTCDRFLRRGLGLLYALVALALVSMVVAATALPFLLWLSGAD